MQVIHASAASTFADACGIDESTRGVGCIQDYVPEATVEDVRRKLLDHFASVFSLDVEETAEDPFA